jgi:hypothetical protein
MVGNSRRGYGFQVESARQRWWVKMGAGRLQAMQMQAALGSGIRQCNAYVHVYTSMSPGTAASRDLPARLP